MNFPKNLVVATDRNLNNTPPTIGGDQKFTSYSPDESRGKNSQSYPVQKRGASHHLQLHSAGIKQPTGSDQRKTSPTVPQQQQQSWVAPTSITKEICKQVHLIKEYVTKSSSTGEGQPLQQFVFRLNNMSLKDVNLTLDFTGSENIKVSTQAATVITNSPDLMAAKRGIQAAGKKAPVNFIGKGNSSSESQMYCGALQNTTSNEENESVVDSFIKIKQAKVFLCAVTLFKDWRMKMKLKFTLKNCSIERQRQEIQLYNMGLKEQIETFKSKFYDFYLDRISIPSVMAKLAANNFAGYNEHKFFDLDFLPCELSLYNHFNYERPLDIAVHWRRPSDIVEDERNLQQAVEPLKSGPASKVTGHLLPNIMDEGKRVHVFYDSIDPQDVAESAKNSILSNEYFLSALSLLASRPPLIERLFITKEWNKEGIFRVRICKGGAWLEVTIDDLFPCEPRGDPIFMGCANNEIWAMILEKAYAKVHGSYYLLNGGFVNEALQDLTGCPTSCYNLKDDYVQHFIANGQFFELLKFFMNEGYLLSFSTHGEEKYVRSQAKNPNDASKEEGGTDSQDEKEAPLPPGQAFAILDLQEFDDSTQIIRLRSPLEKYNWTGDWSEKSGKWTQELLLQLNKDPLSTPNLENSGNEEVSSLASISKQSAHLHIDSNPMNPDNDPNSFWMSYRDVLQRFATLNVCKAINWHEARLKGKFLRIQDIEDPALEIVQSKWYYSLDIMTETKLIVGLHQEDERVLGVLARKPYLDIGISILRRTNEGLKLVDIRDFQQTRSCEIEITLEPGSYIVYPRTTGCTLRRPKQASDTNLNLIEKDKLSGKYLLHPLFEFTIQDIFGKYDMLMNQILGFKEFKGFLDCIGKGENFRYEDFKQEILSKYQSTRGESDDLEEGLSLNGFKDYIQDQLVGIIKLTGSHNKAENIMFQWMENLGYDRDLFSVRSRCFVLTFHSDEEIDVKVQDAVQTDLDDRVNLLIVEKFGQEVKKSKSGYRLLYTFSEKIFGYSYAVQNTKNRKIRVKLDCQKSENMLFSTATPILEKDIEPGATEFMMHSMAVPSEGKFSRVSECSIVSRDD